MQYFIFDIIRTHQNKTRADSMMKHLIVVFSKILNMEVQRKDHESRIMNINDNIYKMSRKYNEYQY